jgi:hypothetical protein
VADRFPRILLGNTDRGSNAFLAPSLAFSMWNPLLASALTCGAQVNEGFGTICSEWQSFVGRRLKEDRLLLERLSASRTPDQIMHAYTDFWQTAAEDYGKETTTMTKLMAGLGNKMVVAAQHAADEAATSVFPHKKAA